MSDEQAATTDIEEQEAIPVEENQINESADSEEVDEKNDQDDTTTEEKPITGLCGSLALNHLLVAIHEDMRFIRAELEVEKSGRAINVMQGKLSGYKKFISAICAEFHLREFEVEDSGETAIYHRCGEDNEFLDIENDTPDELLHSLALDIEDLQKRDEWKGVSRRRDEIIEELKSYLLFSATDARGLDIAQGKYAGIIFSSGFFSALHSNDKQREAKKKEDAKQPSLDFEGSDTTEPVQESVETPEPEEAEAGDSFETEESESGEHEPAEAEA